MAARGISTDGGPPALAVESCWLVGRVGLAKQQGKRVAYRLSKSPTDREIDSTHTYFEVYAEATRLRCGVDGCFYLVHHRVFVYAKYTGGWQWININNFVWNTPEPCVVWSLRTEKKDCVTTWTHSTRLCAVQVQKKSREYLHAPKGRFTVYDTKTAFFFGAPVSFQSSTEVARITSTNDQEA